MDKKNFAILLICTIIAAFLGAFTASILIFSHPTIPYPDLRIEYNKQPLQPGVNESIKFMEEQQKSFEKFDNQIEDVLSSIPRQKFVYLSNNGLKTQETKNEYKITVDLKPFNNDAKNVSLKINGRKILVSAKYSSKDKNDFNSTQFSQALVLPEKIDASKVQKLKQGNFLVIIIPKVSNKN